jgi:hypothetical protein
MSENITKHEATQIAEILHRELLELHREMVVLDQHGAQAAPTRIGHVLEHLIASGSAILLNYLGKPALHSDALGYFLEEADFEAGEDDDQEADPGLN